MKFTANQIAGILEGKVEGNPNAEVWNVAKIEEGAPGMISFLANPKYTHYIYETQSSIVIVNDDFEATAPIQTTLIRVPDAYASFAKLLAFYDQMTQNKQGISSLAFVSKSAQCGENLYLGEFAFVGENAKIGNNVKLYPQVYVGDGCIIGDNTVLYPGVQQKAAADTVFRDSSDIYSRRREQASVWGISGDSRILQQNMAAGYFS